MAYNGHKNWNQWNVSLWINNDEGLYRMAQEYVRMFGKRLAAHGILGELQAEGNTHTPDGAPYSVTAITNALRGM
jgi:hypothetical protein